MSDRHRTMWLIAHIESGLAGIRCLSEHFEDVTRQVDCRPCAARSGDTACAVSLLAAPPTPPSRPSPKGSGEPRRSSTKSSPKRTTCDPADRETAWSDRSRVPLELEAARQHRVSSPSAATRGGAAGSTRRETASLAVAGRSGVRGSARTVVCLTVHPHDRKQGAVRTGLSMAQGRCFLCERNSRSVSSIPRRRSSHNVMGSSEGLFVRLR